MSDTDSNDSSSLIDNFKSLFHKKHYNLYQEQIIICKDKYIQYFKRQYENIDIIPKEKAKLAYNTGNYSFDGHKKPLSSDKKNHYIYQKISHNKYITQINNKHKFNLKFIIFLPEKEITRRNFYGKTLEQQLIQKGIHAISYDNWQLFFDKYNGIIPKFDINESEPSPYIVYKRFIDSLYFNMESYNQLSFKHEIKILSTLASYLGAKSITGHEKHSLSDSTKFDANAKLNAPVSGGGGFEFSNKQENSIVEKKEFDNTVDEELFRGKTMFDQRAKSDLLMSINGEIYERLQLTDVVTQRFNGQTKESYTLYKSENIREKIYLNTVFTAICPQFNINFSVETETNKLEEYEFIIEYYNFKDLIINTQTDFDEEFKRQSNINNLFSIDSESEIKELEHSDHSDLTEDSITSNSSKKSKRSKSMNIMESIRDMGDDVNAKFMKWIRTQDVEKFKDQCETFVSQDDVKTFLKNKNIMK